MRRDREDKEVVVVGGVAGGAGAGLLRLASLLRGEFTPLLLRFPFGSLRELLGLAEVRDVELLAQPGDLRHVDVADDVDHRRVVALV